MVVHLDYLFVCWIYGHARPTVSTMALGNVRTAGLQIIEKISPYLTVALTLLMRLRSKQNGNMHVTYHPKQEEKKYDVRR